MIMNRINYSYLLLFSLLLLLSCDDDENVTCNDPTQIIDDCGICAEGNTNLEANADIDCHGDCAPETPVGCEDTNDNDAKSSNFAQAREAINAGSFPQAL